MAAGTFLAVEAALLTRAVIPTVAALPEQIVPTRNTLAGEVAATRKDLDEQIAAARADVLARSERQAERLRGDRFAETDAIRATADRRLGSPPAGDQAGRRECCRRGTKCGRLARCLSRAAGADGGALCALRGQ